MIWPRPTVYPLPCVWLVRTDRERRSLRRFSFHDEKPCPGNKWGHDASVDLEDGPVTFDSDYEGDSTGSFSHRSKKWPTTCDACGYRFAKDDNWQYNRIRLYHYVGVYGDLYTPINSAPPGSVYDALWLKHAAYCGPDGRAIHAVCPNGRHWHIDDRASNCTLPNDNLHQCWVRHGDPTVPSTLHVDKNGLTCAAGAGSIAVDDYHGFLHHGGFTAG